MSVVNIKFTKFDNTPWGFRLAGGSDFPQPLTVIKVAEGGLAECMGLKPGDVVTRLNDRPVSSLTHGQAHEALMLAGNNFVLGVLRPTDSSQAIEGIQDDNIVPYTIPLDQLPPVFPEELLTVPIEELSIEEQVIPEAEEPVEEEKLPEKPVDANSEVVPNKNLTDEEIAQLILEEEELLIPDQGVLGVNFNKIRPRVPKLKESKVLEELQKVQLEPPPRVQELKHTSTFLQKPQRPAPPSKSDLEKQERGEGEQYKVVIKKQQKKSVTERLLEKGLLEPREEQIIEPPIEVNTTDGNNRHDQVTTATIVPQELKMLQVIPRVREINIIQDNSLTDFSSTSATNDNSSSQESAPNMRDLLNLLDSVQSLEALLLRKCAEQEKNPPENSEITSGQISSTTNTDILTENCENNEDTVKINYTPWCNVFKTEVQIDVPNDDVFAEFTINIGDNKIEEINREKIGEYCFVDLQENGEKVAECDFVDFEGNREKTGTCFSADFEENRDKIGGSYSVDENESIIKIHEADRFSRSIKDIPMPNVRRLRKRLRRNRRLKSCLLNKKAPKDSKRFVSSTGRVKLRRRGRYLENYLSRNIASWCRSFNRFIGSKRAKGSRQEFSRRNFSSVARAIKRKFGIINSGENNYFEKKKNCKPVVNYRKPLKAAKKKKIRCKGRYVEKISTSLYFYIKQLISREKIQDENAKRSNVVFETFNDLARSTGCLVSDRIFHRGRKRRLSRKWRYANIDLSKSNRDFRFFTSDDSINSEISAISQDNADDYFDDEEKYCDDGIGDVDKEDFYEEREDFDNSDKRRSSIVSEILNSCGGSFTKLAAYALVPFTSIILLYLYK